MSKTKTTVTPRMTLNPSARGLTSASPVVGANKKFNSFEDFSSYEKMNRSAQDWLEVGETLANQRRNFLTDSYKSQDEILAHSSQFNTLNEHFLELADKYRNQYKDGSETRKAIDSLTSRMSSLRDAEQEYTGLMGQFKDRSDFNIRYAYPSKYKGSGAKTVEDRIAALSGQRTTSRDERDELNYLKQNRYAFYSEKELRQRQKELEKQIKQSQEEDDKLARQTGMFLGAESDKTQSLKSQLAAAQNALRDSVYAKQVSGWDEEHRDKFYNNYGAWLNKISREDQSSHVGMRDAVTGELDAARKGAAEMEKYLRSRGYTDEEMRGLRAYAQSQNNAQRAFENSEYWKKVADSGFLGKVGASAASIPANLMSGMAFVDSALQGLTNGEDAFTGQKQAMDYNASPLAYAGENMRSAVSANMGKVGQFFYDTGMSIADFLAAGGVMKATGAVGKTVNALGKAGRGVGNAAEVMLAGSAANSSMRSAKDRGASDAEALGVGFLAGLAEMAGEHMSIENLRVIENAMSKASSKRTVSNIFKSIGMQAAVEGSEEGITTLANTLSDLVIMGDRSEYNLSVEQYIAEGDTQEEARRKAMRDWLEGLAQDVAGGALSGGVTSGVTIGGSLAHQKVQEAVVGWKDKESLHYLLTVDKALSYAEGTQTRQLAEDIAARLDGASTLADAKVSDSEIGKLIRLMAEEQPEVAESSTTNTRRDPASAFRPAQTQQTERTTAEPEQAQQAEPIELTQTAKAFEAQGIDTKSAIERGEILDTLLSGGAVSNSQLEKIGALNDKAGQAAFTAITGVEVPTGLTASGLRKFYRATAAEYAQQQRLTVDAQEATAQAEANAQIDVQAELAEAINPVSAFKPNVDNAGETGYNKNGRSAEVTGVIDRLNSKAATVEDAMALPEIAAIEREAREATPTNELPNRESIQEEAYRRAMEQGSFNGKDYTAPVRQERRMDIVLGLPGSGKSSVYTERISQEHGSRVVDTDEYRAYIPEYNGRNAGVVHEEASAIKKRVLAQALKNGDNIILSIIGDNAQKLESDIADYTRSGYSVHLHLNELPNSKAMARAIGRAFPEDGSQGRYVSPEIIAGYADKPTQTYLYLTGRSDIDGIQTEHSTPDAGGESGVAGDVAQDIRVRRGDDQSGGERSGGLVSGETSQGTAVQLSSYDWYNNDVDFGQPPILVESSEQGIAKGGAENAGTQSGVSPEARLSVGDAAAREGADGDGDTGARLDKLSGRRERDSVVPKGRLLGRRNSPDAEIVRLSETDKKLISDSGATAVELNDYTEQPAVFSSALEAAREADTINGWAVSPQDAEDLRKRKVRLIMSEDGSTGLGVTPDGDIIGVFKNPQSQTKRVLFTMLPTAIANGGVKLDCYGKKLVKQYQRFGFIPVARVKFDAEYANPGWTADKGEPDIYFMIHNGDSAEVALQKALNGEYTEYSQDYLDSLPEMDYEAAEKYRDEMIEMRGKAVELDDGSKLGFDEFAKQMREKLPDVTETELTEMFNEFAESEAPLPVEETTVEGHTERTIAPEVIAEAADIRSNASHVKVDENVKLSRGQQWLAKFLASSLRETGVITDVEISTKYDADANGAIERGVLTLNPSKLKPGDVLQSIIGHELLHATVDKTKTDGKAKRDTKLVDSIIDALEQVNPIIDLNSRIAERTDAYKAFLSKTTNPATGNPYTKTEVDLLVSRPYIREEIAADEVGKVFAEQHMLNDFAGLRPGLIARAYNTLGKIKNLRSNNSTEAKTMRRYAKETQQRITAALEMAGAYEVENGEATVRASVADKSWDKQTELGFIALGLRNVDGYTNADYAAAREELGESCFIMKSVPAVLQEIGLGQKPLTYTQTHFVNATLPIEYGENGRANAHGISEDTITKLPELLSSPVMALKTEYINKTTGKAEDAVIVIVDAYDSEGSPVGAVILPNGEAIVDGVRDQSNHILSVYGFESIEDQMRRAQAENGFLYVNSSRADKMLRKIGQKKSAEPINSPDNTSEEYSANEAVSDTASRIPQGMKDFSTRPDAQARQSRKPTPLQRVTSSSNSVAQNERLVNSRYKALAANPYLRGVEFDTVHPLGETTESAEQTTRMLPESLMRSEYKRDGQLLRWSREGDVWTADTVGKDTSYLNMSSPLIIDCGGADAAQLGSVSGERGDSVKAIRDYVYANEMQYDGIVLRNLSINGRVVDTAITLTDAQVIPSEQSDTVTFNGTRFSVTEREYAPTFYSKLERVIESQKQDKLGASSVVNMLRGKGVKAEEIKWSGIETFLDGKKSVTKAELLDFLHENQLQIDTVQLGDKESGDESDNGTRWSEYTLGGGENYRELLYTIPNSDYHNQSMDVHWGRDGVLAHARVQDFVNAEGKSVLFVEEIQSDWHNAGQKSGHEGDAKIEYTDFVLKNLIRDAAEQGYDQIAWTTGVQQEARWSSDFAEGYRIEYDQDIPSFLKKYGKQWGAKVGYTLIGKDLTNSSAYRDGGMEAVMTIAANTADETGSLNSTMHVVHSMDITDAMRESVLYEGQPRFSVAKQSDTEQTDSAADDELFAFDNAVRFAVGGGRTIDDFVSEILRRREVSRVRSNTFQRSGIFTQAELAMPGLAAKDMEYPIATERSSIAEAERRLTEDYEGAKSALAEKTGAWDGADLDTAMGVLSQEVENARQNNDYRTVIQWAQRIRARGTQAGQMVQAFAKYTRTPEGVLVRAAADLENSTLNETQRADLLGRIAQFSETLDAIQTGDKDALIELIRKQAKQRNTPVSEKTLKAMRADTTDFQFLYDTALTQLDQIAKDYVKTNLGRKVATFQTIAHLLNLKTTNRNLGSNNVFTLVDTVASDVAMLPDLLLSAITGQRTVGLDRSRFSKAARAGSEDARNRARIEVALDVAPDDTRDKYGTSRRTWKMTGGRAARGMSTLEKAMGFTLNYTDESAKGAIRAQVMQSLQPFVENGTLTTEEAQQFAEEEARYRTFQDDTAIATLMGQAKRLGNVIGFGGATPLVSGKKLKTHDFGLGDFVVKYTQVPGALITRAAEFSPLGYAKALWNAYGMFQARHELNSRTDLSAEKKAELKAEQNWRQRRAALFMGRASTGTGLIAFFAALAAKGILSNGDDEDDPDAKALNAAMGINGTQLNISALGRQLSGDDPAWREGDVMASLDFLEPLNSAMAMGTLIAKSDEGIDLLNMASSSFTTLVNGFANLSVMQTLRTIIDTLTYYTPDSGIGIKDETADKWATVGLNIALSGATGFIPSPVRQLAQALDDKNRDAYSERGILPKTWAQIRNVIPGRYGRETLPEKQTNFGEPKPTENALLRAVNAFAMPGNISTYKPSSAADELASVYGETDEANIYPDRNAPYKVTKGQGRDKEEYKLTPEARAQYLRTRGQLSKELIDSTRSSAAYDRADEFEKADMLIKAKNYANYIAKREAFADMGVSYEGDPTYEGYKEMLDSGVNLFDFLSYGEAKNELEADIDENGDPISGTKKAKTIELIGSLNMDSDQKEALYFKAYPNEREDFETLGIDFDSYYTYSRTMCTLKGDKDSNGKTISGSKKEKVVNLIDSLNISSEAKTQLYLDNGYTSKSIPRWS